MLETGTGDHDGKIKKEPKCSLKNNIYLYTEPIVDVYTIKKICVVFVHSSFFEMAPTNDSVESTLLFINIEICLVHILY